MWRGHKVAVESTSSPLVLDPAPFMQICFLCVRKTKTDLSPSHIVFISELLSLKSHRYCCALLREERKGEGKGRHARMHGRVTACADLSDTADSFNSWYMHAESLAFTLIQIPIYWEKKTGKQDNNRKNNLVCSHFDFWSRYTDRYVLLVGRCSCAGWCLQSITSSYTDRRR